MAIQRKSAKPAGITNEKGEPEIVLAIGDKIISLSPPARPGSEPEPDTAGEHDAEDAAG